MVRLKNRYLVIELTWKDGKFDDSINTTVLIQALRESVAANFGDYGIGSALAGLAVKYYSPHTELAVVRCPTAELEKVITSLALLTEVKQRRLVARTVRLCGSVASCRTTAHACSAQRLLAAGPGRQQHRAAAEASHAQLRGLEL